MALTTIIEGKHKGCNTLINPTHTHTHTRIRSTTKNRGPSFPKSHMRGEIDGEKDEYVINLT